MLQLIWQLGNCLQQGSPGSTIALDIHEPEDVLSDLPPQWITHSVIVLDVLCNSLHKRLFHIPHLQIHAGGIDSLIQGKLTDK